MKQPPLPKLYRLANAARRHGVARTTLITAAEDQRLTVWTTACGCRLTTDAEVKRFLADTSEPRGKPRKSAI